MRLSAPLLLLAIGFLLIGETASAQAITLDLGDDGSLATRSIQLLLLITVLSIVPGIAVTLTCFPFIVTVLSILRQAIGLQQSPPNMLMISLAMFLTYFVMEPVFTVIVSKNVEPGMRINATGDITVFGTVESGDDHLPSHQYLRHKQTPSLIQLRARNLLNTGQSLYLLQCICSS